MSTSKSFPILINNFPFFNKSLDRSNYANKPAFRDCLLTFKQRSYELAEHFEVSARTTLQDIDILSTAGIPVYTTQGKCGGIFIMENFVLNKTTLSNEEQNQILFALQNLTPTQQVTSNELLAKLSSLFNKTDTSWIEVNFSRWGNNDADTQRFRILKNAILQKQAIVFDYFSSYGETSRTVYPLKLLFKSKSWYLQAYCLAKKDYRVFKLNRMKCITTSPTYFTDKQFSHPPNSFDTLSSANLISLELLFNSSVAYRVYDEFKAEQIIKNQDGSFTVFVDFPNVSWLYDFLLSFGTSVKVIKPLSVREELFAETQNILNSYITN